MPVSWSRIHAALGLDPQQLTFAHIEAAVEASVAESDDLDWKRAGPTSNEVAAIREFTKDIAAMANTRGGLIVFGVAESGDGRASEIVPMEADERARRRMRQWAQAIRPPVPGLALEVLSADGGDRGVLVLTVPQSPDAPHLIGDASNFGAPYRNGPETQWMSDRDLERAYRDRAASQADDRQSLLAMVEDAQQHLDPARRPWLIGVATPRLALAATAPTPRADQVQPALVAALDRAAALGNQSRPHVLLELGGAALNPRIGRRRWVVRTRRSEEPEAMSSAVHVELHSNGAVVMAASLPFWNPTDVEIPGAHAVQVRLLEVFALEMVALVGAYANEIGLRSDYSVRLDIDAQGGALAAIDNMRVGGYTLGSFEQPSWSVRVRRFYAVEATLPADPSVTEQRSVVTSLARDMINQFSINVLHHALEPEVAVSDSVDADAPSPTPPE